MEREPDSTMASTLVVGGANGIGRACVEHSVGQGDRVIVADRDHQAGARLESEHPGLVQFVAADVTDPDDVARAVAACGPGLRSVVHAPYVDERGSVEELSGAAWDRVHHVVLRSAYLVAGQCAPVLARSAGSLTFVSSVQARFGNPRQAAYAAAKAGVEGLVRQLAVDLGPRGVRVNAVAPSVVVTPRNRLALQQAGRLDSWPEAFPLRRLCRPEEVASVIAFLASDAASYVHGVVLPVDGGSTAFSSVHAYDRGLRIGTSSVIDHD